MEKEKESIPIALREISFDQAEKFTLIRCLAVLTDKVIENSIGIDTFINIYKLTFIISGPR